MTEYNETTNSGIQAETEKKFIPESLGALIVSVVSLFHMAFLGWIPAIIALKLANNAIALIDQDPGIYTENSKNMAFAARKMAVWGLIAGIIGMFVTFFYYYWIFTLTSGHHHYYYNYY